MWKKGRLPIKWALSFMLGTYLVYLSASFPETNAYLKDHQFVSAVNQLGELKVTLEDAGTTTTTNLPKGTTLPREVTVHNQGAEEVFVRVLIHPMLTDKAGLTKAVTVADVVADLTTSDWQEGPDGYYYYLKRLGITSSTKQTTLFTTIKGGPNMVNQDRLQLVMKVEAITVRDDAYRQAWWQGVTPTAGSLKQVDDQLFPLREQP